RLPAIVDNEADPVHALFGSASPHLLRQDIVKAIFKELTTSFWCPTVSKFQLAKQSVLSACDSNCYSTSHLFAYISGTSMIFDGHVQTETGVHVPDKRSKETRLRQAKLAAAARYRPNEVHDRQVALRVSGAVDEIDRIPARPS